MTSQVILYTIYWYNRSVSGDLMDPPAEIERNLNEKQVWQRLTQHPLPNGHACADVLYFSPKDGHKVFVGDRVSFVNGSRLKPELA